MPGVRAGECLFMCVVGPGFDSTSPAIVRSRASPATVFQPRAGCVFLELGDEYAHHRRAIKPSFSIVPCIVSLHH